MRTSAQSATLALLLVASTAHAADFGTEPDEATLAVALEADVDPYELLGAMNTTGLEARDYLVAAGELAAPIAVSTPVGVLPGGWPIGGALGARLYCVEDGESSHGRFMYNPRGWPPPLYNEHAQGWLGFLPSTAARWGAAIGNRASEWAAAARMIAAGAGAQFAGIASGRC